MTHQLVNILEYIIPEFVDAEIQLHNWESQFDELAKQQIVLELLNRVHPCYQLLTPESQAHLSPLSKPLTSEPGQVGAAAFNPSTARATQTGTSAPCSETGHSLAVESLLPSHILQQLQAAISTEIAKHVTGILSH